MPILSPTETLERHINQNGVLPGPQKLAQFQQALRLRDTPPLYSQDGRGDEAVVYVKIFDPSGTWTWYLTEWDGAQEAFGLVRGDDCELGYVSLFELASIQGALGIGLEIDVYFKPTTLREIRRTGFGADATLPQVSALEPPLLTEPTTPSEAAADLGT